jgi:hypothetical protein
VIGAIIPIEIGFEHEAAVLAVTAALVATFVGRATAVATIASDANPATTAISPNRFDINSLLWDCPR